MGTGARAVVTGSVGLAVLQWMLWGVDPSVGRDPVQPAVVTGLMAANIVLTLASPRAKRTVVAAVQRWTLNPVVRLLFRIGFVPFGYALLETTGRVTQRPRVVPVGNGHRGGVFWIVAEHGERADYVKNLRRDPRVRVRFRRGLRFVWVSGVAQVVAGDDPLARQRLLCGWRPLRWLNAVNVRALSAEPVTVRIDLVDITVCGGSRTSAPARSSNSRTSPARPTTAPDRRRSGSAPRPG